MTQREINRLFFLELFKRKETIWKDDEHPELKDGASAWVHKMRALDEVRFQEIQKQRGQTAS